MAKRKINVAIAFGYLGTRFRGLQIQQYNIAGQLITVPTVENFLEHALATTGGIHELNRGNLKRVKWSRSSRTDSSVHAGCNVIALRMLADDAAFDETTRLSASIVDELNAVLPHDIRVFSVAKVTRSFDAKRECNMREYAYMVPASLLGTTLDAAKLESALRLFEGSQCYWNFSKVKQADGRKSSSVRTIYRAAMGEKVEVEAKDGTTELVPIVLKGQSFLTRQIRFIVGAALGVACGDLPLEAIESALRAPQHDEPKPLMPLAPAQFLMVVGSSFVWKKEREINLTLTTHSELEVPHLGDSTPLQLLTEELGLPAQRAFTTDLVLPHIAQLATRGFDGDDFNAWEMKQGGAPRLEVKYPLWRESDRLEAAATEAEAAAARTPTALQAFASFVAAAAPVPSAASAKSYIDDATEEEDAAAVAAAAGDASPKKRIPHRMSSLASWLTEELPGCAFGEDELDSMATHLAEVQGEEKVKRSRHAALHAREAEGLLHTASCFAAESIPKLLPQGIASTLTSHFDLRPGPLVTNLQRGLIHEMRHGLVSSSDGLEDLVEHVAERGIEVVAMAGLEAWEVNENEATVARSKATAARREARARARETSRKRSK
tara:strand:- start:5 stop:1825 length:1821 start_codon:yes stop_codon:yes gene_type:complete